MTNYLLLALKPMLLPVDKNKVATRRSQGAEPTPVWGEGGIVANLGEVSESYWWLFVTSPTG